MNSTKSNKRGRKRKVAPGAEESKGSLIDFIVPVVDVVDTTDVVIPPPPSPPSEPIRIPERAPRHNSQNFYTSLLEQKKVRYKVNKWLADHAKFDLHSDAAAGCWKCNLAKDVQCGDVNLFETWYMMKQESKTQGYTCPQRIKLLCEGTGAFVPEVRCVQSKNGWCRCQDWVEVSSDITEN